LGDCGVACWLLVESLHDDIEVRLEVTMFIVSAALHYNDDSSLSQTRLALDQRHANGKSRS
jgi:hypothetical protein